MVNIRPDLNPFRLRAGLIRQDAKEFLLRSVGGHGAFLDRVISYGGDGRMEERGGGGR